ncbi:MULTISPECIES: hypothetical protein [Bacillus]|uniref:hypothetical protein n=1 Tax=Bacillus TaxID=1386 RepID=UPI0006AFD3C4|nr:MULTISPECIES: hypothetical protein [Bacillus]ARJ76184.1 hypothetical protein B7941_17330 [Bacillus velezensis]AWD88894.1 hypothetical protein BVQ_16165 [Bacillus velezensis]KAF6691093.1 hypothetical protein G9362_15775 [Bacillus sp. EKM601B]KOS49304.1 hypothetical protein AN272_19170 [Bacillus amyloliquefaciens]MBA9148548.1 hypothetical protein [Bacillus sp. EKM213B]
MLIKIEVLTSGKTFKNYKVLCGELGLEVKRSGDSRKAQFKELERYCTYSKVGHSIIIEEVFEQPLQKIKRQGNNTVYSELLQLLILDMLAQSKNGNISISKGRLIKSVSLVNQNYKYCFEKRKSLARYANTDTEIVKDFYDSSNNSFKKAVVQALNKLVEKRLIMYDVITKVCEKGKFRPRKASSAEKKMIMACEKKVLDELGYKELSHVRVSRHWNEFKRRSETLLKECSNLKYYFAAYDITANDKYIENECEELIGFLLKEIERVDYKEKLNHTACSKLLKNAEGRHKKSYSIFRENNYRISENYIRDFKKLIDLLINEDAESISYEIEQMEAQDDLSYDIAQSLPSGL